MSDNSRLTRSTRPLARRTAAEPIAAALGERGESSLLAIEVAQDVLQSLFDPGEIAGAVI